MKAFFLDVILSKPLYFQAVQFAISLSGEGYKLEEEQPGGQGSTPCDRCYYLSGNVVLFARTGLEKLLFLILPQRENAHILARSNLRRSTHLFSTETTVRFKHICVKPLLWVTEFPTSQFNRKLEIFYSWWWFFYRTRVVNSQLPHSASHKLLLPSYPGKPIKSSNFLF